LFDNAFIAKLINKFFVISVTKQNGDGTGSASNSIENILEKGEVEATKEDEKEKNKIVANNKDEKEVEVDEDKDKEAANEQEVVFIQDMGFNVKIVSPGAETFDIQVSSMELVQVGIIIRFPIMIFVIID
jgi:protein TIF31